MIIGFSGKCGSGKDEACKYMKTKYGFYILRFAAKIKEIVSLITNTSLKDNYTNKSKIIKKIPYLAKELYVIFNNSLRRIYIRTKLEGYTNSLMRLANKVNTYRNKSLAQLQVIIGEGFRANVCKNVWIDCLFEQILINKKKNICIADLRFKNEAKALVNLLGAQLIRIDRAHELRKKHLCWRDPNHATEIDLDDYKFKHLISNNETKEVLYLNIDMIYSKIKI